MQLGYGPTVISGVFIAGEIGTQRAAGTVDEAVDWERLGGVVAGIYAVTRRQAELSAVDNGEGAVAGAVVQPVGPADGGWRWGIGSRSGALWGWGCKDTPDHATISRFRTELARRGLSERLFGELAAQLEERGLLVKAGTLLDATLVEAQVRRPSTDAGLGAKSERDPDADWTRSGRSRRSHFGYKMHVGVDAGTLLVLTGETDAGEVAEP